MVNIELTPQQVEELKNFYANELENIQRRADEIKGLLNKLDTKTIVSTKPAIIPDKVVPTPDLTSQPKKSIKVKPRKTKNPNWRHFILKVLKENDKPLTSGEIIKLYYNQHNLDLPASPNSLMALSQALHRLRVKDNIVKSSKIKGKREKRYGLIDATDKSVVLTENAKAKKPVPLNPNQKPKTIIRQDNKPPLITTYNWPKFVFETLNKTKRVLSAKDFLKHALVYYNVPKKDSALTRSRLSPALSRMEKITKSLKTCKKAGQAGRFYGLPEWFDGDNKLKVDYK